MPTHTIDTKICEVDKCDLTTNKYYSKTRKLIVCTWQHIHLQFGDKLLNKLYKTRHSIDITSIKMWCKVSTS